MGAIIHSIAISFVFVVTASAAPNAGFALIDSLKEYLGLVAKTTSFAPDCVLSPDGEITMNGPRTKVCAAENDSKLF